MVELVDTLVLGTSAATRGGSSPLLGTKVKAIRFFLIALIFMDSNRFRQVYTREHSGRVFPRINFHWKFRENSKDNVMFNS